MKMRTLNIAAAVTLLSVLVSAAMENPRAEDESLISRWSPPGLISRHILSSPEAMIQCARLESDAPYAEVWTFFARRVGSKSTFSKGQLRVEGGADGAGRYFLRDTEYSTMEHGRKTLFVYRCAATVVTVNLSRRAEYTLIEVVAME